MRLLLTADTVGGVWTFACELTRGLLLRGHDVLLVSFGQPPSASQACEAATLSENDHCRYVANEAALEWQPTNETAFAAGEALLLSLAEQFRPEAFVLSQFCFGALPVRVPKIVVAHSDVLSWAKAVGKAPLADDVWLRTYRTLVQEGLSGADLVVAPTAAMMNGLREHFDVQVARTVISNGRSLPHFPKSPERQLRAVTAGRMWDPAKNLALLQSAELPLPVLVAGEAQAEMSGTATLSGVGQLAPDALLELLHGSAIYICCSRYEPFGLAALEAGLCGCAVLANDILSLREVWGDGALYFHDTETLSQLLRALVADPALLESAQARSAARAQRYSAAAMTEGYLQAVDSLSGLRSEAAHAA